jgi:hypothetical protein
MASPTNAIPPVDREDLAEARPQLPPAGGRIDRIGQHSKSLIDELTHWADLKIKLVKVDLAEKVEEKKIQVGLGVGMALVGFFAVLFLLTTIALALGWLLGHPTWGFLIVTVILFGIVFALKVAMPKLIAKIEKRVSVDAEHLSYRIVAPAETNRSQKPSK